MKQTAVDVVKEFVQKLNTLFKLSVECNIVEREHDKFPICIRSGNLAVIPEFFNHPDLPEDVKINMMAEMYSSFYIYKDKNNHIDVSPLFMTKGICEKLGVHFYSECEKEKILRAIRRKLYGDSKNSCYFDVGMRLRGDFEAYEVLNILRKTPTETIITVKAIGSNFDEPNQQFTEEELFDRCFECFEITNEKVSMRENLVVISGPSGVGKDAVVRALIEKQPEIKKTVSITTRAKRSNDINGVNYHFVSKDEFYDYVSNGDLIEHMIYNDAYYGTLYSEIERHSEDTPLILVVDVHGRRNVIIKYPLAKTIFISPPSFEVLKERLISRNENTPEQIEERLRIAQKEIKEAPKYLYKVVNDDIQECVQKIAEIIRQSGG